MKPDFRVVFIGAVECSRHCLNEVIGHGVKPVGIFTLPNHLANLHADFADLSDIAGDHDIPIHYIEDVNASVAADLIRQYSPDVIFVWGWSRIIRGHILSIPRLGCVGLHPAMLPANRGRHPIIWAIVLGLPYSGLTFFWMDEGADSGDILAQKRIELAEDESARTLYDKIKLAASDLIAQFLPRLMEGSVDRIPQNHQMANTWRKRGKADGQIDFRMSALTINRLVRALGDPYSGAHIMVSGSEVKVRRVKTLPLKEQDRCFEFGRVLGVKEREVTVRAAEGLVVLVDHDLDPLPELGVYL